MHQPSTPRRRHNRRLVAGALGVTLAAGVGSLAGQAVPGTASANDPQVKVKINDGTLFIRGGSADDVIALRVLAAAPDRLVIDLGDDGIADIEVRRDLFARIVVRAGYGNDTVTIDESAGVPFTDTIPTSLAGQWGDDTLLGGSGVEQFRGGPGTDVVDGNRGNDIAWLGAGDDEFIWDPGDGSDVIDGRSGDDLMTFNGSDGNEVFEALANGDRLRFTRSLGSIVMDTDNLEQVTVNALLGSDVVRVFDLSSTDVVDVDIDEAGLLGGTGADGTVDHVVVSGTPDADSIGLAGSAGIVDVTGLVPTVTITNVDPFDTLTISALRGSDTVDASALGADTLHLDVLAGAGDDTVRGGAGSDTVLAGSGRDVVDGNRGNDTAFLDSGLDEFIWDPGDGSDIIEGGSGHDVMTFNGSSGTEVFEATPVGDRLRFTRDLGNIVMDTGDVEQVDLNTLAGADVLTVDDLTGTDVRALDVDLAGVLGASTGDGEVDAITINGTTADDAFELDGSDGSVSIAGLFATIDLDNADPNDRLLLSGLGGADTVDTTALAPDTIALTFTD